MPKFQQISSAANSSDCPKEAEMNKQKLTICYSRLSREDSRIDESLSIKNQKDMLETYAKQNGFTPFLHLTDDGFSGTQWARPGWQELISRVESGEVCTILLKTMNRMGRDYLRVGLNREMFREKNIRLIAVREGYDSDKGEDDFTPFKDIISEYYARDTSRKIRSVFKSRMENGKRCSGSIPYGFIPNNGDTQDLIIDEIAAENVRRIFAMIIEGHGVNDIARTFYNEQIPIPSEHWKRTGQPSRSPKYTDPYLWSPTTISYIVAKPEYKGTVVLGKTQNASYKGHKAVKTAPEKQYVFENALPQIVSTETWELAQKLKKTVRRTPKLDEVPNPLTGLLYCYDCNSKLSHRRSKNSQGYPENAYVCSQYRKGIKQNCTIHYISVKNLEKLILAAIKRVSCYVRDNNTEFVEKVRAASIIQQEKSVKESKTKLTKSKRRIEELNGLIKRLYEDNASGKIPDKHFERMFVDYDNEQTSLETTIAELQSAVDTFNSDSVKADNFIDLAMKYTEFETLNSVMLNEFISRIFIHEKDKSGERITQEVDIEFNFIGNFIVPEDYDEYSPEERAAINAERERLDKKNAYEKELKRRQRESDWHKRDHAKRKAMREAIATKAESELTQEEIEFAAEENARRQKRKDYMREYSRERSLKQKQEREMLAATA